ncbi:helix-turn-helix domain-containing protein [Kocuria rosea]|uniref:helix-turn-helix domain-containing protein n=1 Tax=Kocuria rosea TaxID=1275 RepID=UPI0011A8682C|nr:helix-turn-helix domain-containing protein [Kocuria rosea]
MTQTMPQLIGDHIRALRQAHDLTLDDIATAGKRFGAKWSPSRVRRMELGEGSITVETLLLLALALSTTTKARVTPSDLLQTNLTVELTPPLELNNEELQDVLLGRFTNPDDYALDTNDEHLMSAIRKSLATIDVFIDVLGEDVTRETVKNGWAQYGLADQRASKKLGVSDTTLLAWSIKLWGHPLSVEAEHRAGDDATPQAKGHHTRALIQELSDAMREQ